MDIGYRVSTNQLFINIGAQQAYSTSHAVSVFLVRVPGNPFVKWSQLRANFGLTQALI